MNSGDIFIGFDADERNLSLAKTRLNKIQIQNDLDVEIILIHSNFTHLREKLAQHDIHSLTGIYYDL